MKLHQLFERSSGQVPRGPWYHCGPEVNSFYNMAVDGSQNHHMLGHGVFLINNADAARKMVRQPDAKTMMYEIHVNATADQFYSVGSEPAPGQAAGLDKIANQLGFHDRNQIPMNHAASQHGQGIPGAVFEKFGPEKGAQLLKQAGIVGQYESVNGQTHLVIWDMSVLQVIKRAPIQGNTQHA